MALHFFTCIQLDLTFFGPSNSSSAVSRISSVQMAVESFNRGSMSLHVQQWSSISLLACFFLGTTCLVPAVSSLLEL